jgi:hypothetical protein
MIQNGFEWRDLSGSLRDIVIVWSPIVDIMGFLRRIGDMIWGDLLGERLMKPQQCCHLSTQESL